MSWPLVLYGFDFRSALKWSLEGQRYKVQVRGTQTRKFGELQHVEWDGWGWGGIDNTVYLVFDPNDMKADQKHSSGTFPGVSCNLLDATRLERHYYSVLFYTDSSWDYCTY